MLAALGLAAVMTWPTLRDPTAHRADRQLAWSGHAAATTGRAAVALQRVLSPSVQLRVHRHPARVRAGRPARHGLEAAVLRYNIMYVLASRARLPRRRTPWPASSAPPAPRRPWPARRSRTRRGGWPRPGTCTSCPPAASRWRWPCWPAATAGRCATATGRTGARPAGRWPAGWSRPGRSASASASACRSRTCWRPASAVVAVVASAG